MRTVVDAIEEQIAQHWRSETITTVPGKVRRALELLRSELPDEASTLLVKALAEDPGNLHAHLLLARIAADAANLSLYERHTRTSIRLLGTTGNSDVSDYAAVILSLREVRMAEIRSLLTEKTVLFAATPRDCTAVIFELAQNGWCDAVLDIARLVKLNTCTPELLSILLANNCIDAAIAITTRLLDFASQAHDAVTFALGATVAFEVSAKHHNDVAVAIIPDISTWPVDAAFRVYETLIANDQRYLGGMSPSGVGRLQDALLAAYSKLTPAFEKRIKRLAVPERTDDPVTVVATGCYLAFATYMALALIFMAITVLFHLGETPLALALWLSPLGGIVGTSLYYRKVRSKQRNESSARLQEQQRFLEVFITTTLTRRRQASDNAA